MQLGFALEALLTPNLSDLHLSCSVGEWACLPLKSNRERLVQSWKKHLRGILFHSVWSMCMDSFILSSTWLWQDTLLRFTYTGPRCSEHLLFGCIKLKLGPVSWLLIDVKEWDLRRDFSDGLFSKWNKYLGGISLFSKQMPSFCQRCQSTKENLAISSM